MATHFHPLQIKDIRKETSECVSISFEIPEELKDEYRFHQGQNITLRLKLEDEEIRRSYSICSSPFENELRVAVKKVESGRFSSQAMPRLKIGDLIDVLPPTGKFYTPLHKDQKKKYLAFAAGSGITPVISIISTTLETEPGSTFTLIYGNRNRASIIFREQLEALKNRYMQRLAIHHVLSRERMDADINTGRIDADKCDKFQQALVDILSMDEIFLCGPSEMIFSVKSWLEEKGFQKNHIHFELFGTPSVNTGKTGPTNESSVMHEGKVSKVSVKLDGLSFDYLLPYAGASILDASLQQGADLPYACKGGVCATCKAKLIQGEVAMDTNFALEPDELAAGFILTCQSHPRTEQVVVDFDSR